VIIADLKEYNKTLEQYLKDSKRRSGATGIFKQQAKNLLRKILPL
jgi:hypothetical protein